MRKHLLQDIRRKDTRLAYEREILDCSHDLIAEFIEYNGCENIDTSDIKQVSNFLLLNVFDVEVNNAYEQQLTPNIYERVENWLMNRMTFGCYHYDICVWLVKEGLVASDFIPPNNDLTLNMQLAGARHWNYLARTLLNNVDYNVINYLQKPKKA